ncbi:hypothetical protein [Nannocystis pusilla]|uniref:Flagellar hook-length control protein FliK n=1 Tax=Nannocystis pusilla TaxID=889268 RepID=A0ABS7TJW4_9BACT|nr:hypothetical protein [Nannocystis pusilla]MBZ5708520.1 hypothetical protein [Nannocystis pusilla]
MRLAVHASVVCLAGLLAGTTARASMRRDEAPAIDRAAIVVSVGAGLDPEALHEALALREPGIHMHDDAQGEPSCRSSRRDPADRQRDGTDEQPGCTLVRIEREPTGSLRISVRLDDGRVFVRSWSATPAEPERAAATSLSHLLAAIADGTAEQEPPAVETTVPASASPTSAPEVSPSPVASRPLAEQPSPQPPRFEFGPTVGLVTAFGVGPPVALAGSVGSGGLVGVEVRHRSGFIVGVEARGLGVRADELRLARLRLAVALGHSLRRGRFELRTRAAVLVEPWWVVTRGGAARPQSGPPLLGAALSLTPGLSLPLAPAVRLDVGLRIEAAVSAHAAAGAAVQLVDSAGAPLFRIGGVELAAVAELGVRWGRTSRAAAGKRAPAK